VVAFSSSAQGLSDSPFWRLLTDRPGLIVSLFEYDKRIFSFFTQSGFQFENM